MTILINALGAPSAGRSTFCAELYAKLKSMNLNTEFTQEYVKAWAWEGRKISPYDQFYFFGKEAHHQSKLFNKVDFIISDSPVLLTAFYHWYYNNDNSLRQICHNFYDIAEKRDDVKTLNLFFPRKKPYDQRGRYQTEEQADEVGRKLKIFLEVECYPYTYMDCEYEERVEKVVEMLRIMTNNFKGLN